MAVQNTARGDGTIMFSMLSNFEYMDNKMTHWSFIWGDSLLITFIPGCYYPEFVELFKGAYLVAASFDGSITLWQVLKNGVEIDFQIVVTLDGHENEVSVHQKKMGEFLFCLFVFFPLLFLNILRCR